MNMSTNWKRLKSQKVYENKWLELYHEDVIAPTGNEGIYGRIHYKNFSIGILPIDKDGYTWLVGQHRYPFNTYTWEIPEGGGPIEVDPLDSAKRELAEEVGLKAQKWKFLQETQLSNASTDELGLIYVATDLSLTDSTPDETEDLVVKKIKLEDAINLVLDGTIVDSLTVMALLKVKILRDNGQL